MGCKRQDAGEKECNDDEKRGDKRVCTHEKHDKVKEERSSLMMKSIGDGQHLTWIFHV